MNLHFIESPLFTRRSVDRLTLDEFFALQNELLNRPDAGAVIQGTNGLRKLRFGAKGSGKRGGVRVIYYWLVSDGEIYLLNLYAKNEQSDLTADQKKDLRKVVEVLSG